MSIIDNYLPPILSRAHGYWLETQGSGKIGEPVKILMFLENMLKQ